MNAYSAFAVLKFDNSTPGRENEMPSVLSCNWLPDCEYPVYLQPTPPHDSEGPFVVENTGGEFVASFATKLLADLFVIEGSGCYRHRCDPAEAATDDDGASPPGTPTREELLLRLGRGATPYQRRIVVTLLAHPDGLTATEIAEAVGSNVNSVKVMVLHLRRLDVPIESHRLNAEKSRRPRVARQAERYWLRIASSAPTTTAVPAEDLRGATPAPAGSM